MTEFEFERGEILTNLTLLEDHAEKFQCPYCMEKHASKIIGYAEEIAHGGEDVQNMTKLAEQAREWRRQIQGAKEHTHEDTETTVDVSLGTIPKGKVVPNHLPERDNPRKYEPYGLTEQEKRDKSRAGKCTATSKNRYCRLTRCIKKVEKKCSATGQCPESPVAVCRASVYGS